MAFFPSAMLNSGVIGLAGALLLTGCNSGSSGTADTISVAQVVTTDANIASAAYNDSLSTAQTLKTALQSLVDTPSPASLSAARLAWLAAREPYGQTEVYRFRLSPIDSTDGLTENGPEARINAWPLGEAMIDYVAVNIDGDAGPEAIAPGLTPNLVADTAAMPVINKTTLASFIQAGGDERNVATGYHAIEFLLWGQDLNTGTTTFDGSEQRDSSPGQRPFTDYLTTAGNCTSGAGNNSAELICTRRGQLLLATVELLIDDLQSVVDQWNPTTGTYYAASIADARKSLARIFESMGRLGFGELAGERINIALTQDSQEDEHSCFSDNTHRDILLNAQGIQNSFLGSYTRVDGSVVSGPGVRAYLLDQQQADLANELTDKLTTTMTAAGVIDTKAANGMPFDRQIQQGGINDPDIKAVIAALVSQTQTIEAIIAALQLPSGDVRQDTNEAL